jgi:LuxR family transcriptional regulator, maltose regulon positive regulatory protein
MAGEHEVLGPMLFLEDPPITKARLLLAQGDEPSVAHGQALLDDLLQYVEVIHSTRKPIQVLALQAWAYDLQGRETEALDALERALTLARPGGFIRTFADVQRILAAMSPMASHVVSKEELLRQEGLEPLTERELHILHLLDRDLTNKEIARELVVTPGTVKVHTTNVYRKLSVTNRRAAVTLSKALGLLAANQA